MSAPVTLTEGAVRAVLKRASNRKVQYLCRAYLQFGPEAMTADDLAALTAAINARAGKDGDR